MKKAILFSLVAFSASTLLAADAKDEVIAAAKKLADQPGYSWKTTTVVPEGSRMRPGPTEGKTVKDGITHVSMTLGENPVEMIMKGGKSAVKGEEGWQSTADLENTEGRGRWAGMLARNFTLPVVQATEIAGYAKDLKKEGDAYTGTLSEEGVKKLVTWRRGNTSGEAPTVSNPSGNAKFWIKDGVLSKFEYHVKGTVSWNGNDRETDRKVTVEIKETGKPTINVPEEALKKVS